MLKITTIAVFLALLFTSNLFAQNKLEAGLSFTAEYSNGGSVAGIGAIIDYQITRHSGIESGLYYRPFHESFYYYTPQSSFSLTIAERHLSIPVLYKFSSRVVNFAVGPTFDFFIGWRQKTGHGSIDVDHYSLTPSFNPGAMLKVSKDIKLTDNVSLEPDIRFNPVLTAHRAFLGIGITGKYLLK